MTLADRELLALAARAAGKLRAEWDYDWLLERGVSVSRDMLWNPLENSGQALELQVLLRMRVHHDGSRAYVELPTGQKYCWTEAVVEHGLFAPLAATRRAITRAAASTVAA